MVTHKWNKKKGKRRLQKDLKNVEENIRQLRAERKRLLQQLDNIEWGY